MTILRRLAAALSADRVAALLFLAVFAAYGVGGSRIRAALDSDVVGPGFFPDIIAVLGVVLAVIMLLRPDDDGVSKPLMDFDPVALAPAALLLVYVLVLEYLGFALATVMFLILAFRYLGCPGWTRPVLYSLVATAAIVGLFRYGLDLSLPRGELIRLF